MGHLMGTVTGHLIGRADGVSVAVPDQSVDGADVVRVMTKSRQEQRSWGFLRCCWTSWSGGARACD